MTIGKSNQKVLLAAMILAVSMTTIDQTIVALSADTIQSELGISHALLTWSINAYILATAAFFLLGGKLADVYGHKRMVMIGIAGFAFFSLLCGLTPATDIAGPWLITSRAFQGVCTAIMFPAALGIVYSHFSVESRGKAVATFFAITGAMTALGPILGGVLTSWTWRSIFWINIPIAIVALILIARQHVTDAPSKNQSIDWKGAALVAASMALSITGLQQAGTWGWDSPATWAFIIAGVVLFGLFILFERNRKSPLVSLVAFKDRGFSISVLAIFFASMAFIPIFFFLSTYAQISLNLSVNTSALLLLEFFIGFTLASRWGGALFDKKGARLPLIIGGALGAIGFAWWASKLGMLANGGAFLDSPQFWPTVLSGAGIGFMFSAAATNIANKSVGAAYGESTAISQTARNFGGALGLALLAALVATHLSSNLTTSFAEFGAPASAATAVAQDINSQTKSGPSAEMAALPEKVQLEIEDAVRDSYANATKAAFYGMSAAMAAVLLLGLLYPKTAKVTKRKIQ